MGTEFRQNILIYIWDEIDFYNKASTSNHKKWYALVLLTIGGAAIGGLCAIVQTQNSYIRFALGIPSVLASVGAAINSTMNYRGERTRQAATAEALKRELLKFETKRPPYDGEENASLTKFTETAMAILDTELATWLDSQKKPDPKPGS